ncbi:hypothetical protein [Nitrobacter sp. JJSN]|uniref:hypothetical protein n=1 Tax=Nitrobacter sp. JJSN TaxID=3453033 RepID=UPI003F7626E9
MSDDLLGDKLREVATLAAADAYMQREEFYRAVGQTFQEGEAAIDNFAYVVGRWGDEKAIEILQSQTSRIGQLRGSMFSADGWRVGATGARAEAADALEKLPELWHKTQQSNERAITARAAYVRYCHETGRDPERRTAEQRATDSDQARSDPGRRPPGGGAGVDRQSDPRRPSYWESFQREGGQGEDDPDDPSIERERSR